MPVSMVPAAEVDIFQPNAYANGGAVGALRDLHQASGQMASQLSQLAGVGGNGQSQGFLGGFSGFNDIFSLPTFSTPTAPSNLPSIPPPLSPVPTAAVSNETPVTSIGQSQNTGGLFGRAITEPAPVATPLAMTNDTMSRSSYPTDEAYNDAMGSMGPIGGITPRPEVPSFSSDSASSVSGSLGNAMSMGNSSNSNFRDIPSIFGSIGNVFGYEDGGAVPMRTDIAGQPHMLSYITPGEAGVLKAMGGAGKPGPGGIPSFYTNFSSSDGTPGNSSSDNWSSGGYDPVGTGVVNDPGWSSGHYSSSDDSPSFFGSTPDPGPVYYDSFGNVYTTQAKATAADNLAAQQAAEAAAAQAAAAEAARIEQANQQQAVDIALNQAADRRQQQIEDALQATTIPGGQRPQVSLTSSSPQQSTVYSKDVIDVDPFAMPGSAPAFAQNKIESTLKSGGTLGYTPEPTGYNYDTDLLGLTDPRAEMNLLQDEALAKDLTSRMGGVNVNPVTGEITPVSTPMDAGEFNIKPDRGDALAKEITAAGGIVDVNPETGQIIGNFPNTPSQSLLTNAPIPDLTEDLVDIALPAPRPGTLVDYADPTQVPIKDSGLSAPVPGSTLSTSVLFGDDDEYTGMQGAQVPVGTIPPDERDEEVVSALSDDFLDEQGRADLNVLAGEAIDYFNNPLVKGIQSIEGILPLSSALRALSGRNSLMTTNAGLPAGRIGEMQMGVQRGGNLVTSDSGSPLYVEMPDGTRVGEYTPPESSDGTPEFIPLSERGTGTGTSAAEQEVEEIIKGLSGIGTSAAPVTTTITSTPTTPAQGGFSLGSGYGQMKQTPSNLDSAMENFFRMMGGYAEGGEVK